MNLGGKSWPKKVIYVCVYRIEIKHRLCFWHVKCIFILKILSFPYFILIKNTFNSIQWIWLLNWLPIAVCNDKRFVLHSTKESWTSYCKTSSQIYGSAPLCICISSQNQAHHNFALTGFMGLGIHLSITWAEHSDKVKQDDINANKSCYLLFVLFSKVSETEMGDSRVGSGLKHYLRVHSNFCVQFHSYTQGTNAKEK